jgi:hypothetical protein
MIAAIGPAQGGLDLAALYNENLVSGVTQG